MADVQDVLIVGGGAAGYTAGIFAGRGHRRAGGP
jgi:thioredoxin reductase